jgi:hypothetical protein
VDAAVEEAILNPEFDFEQTADQGTQPRNALEQRLKLSVRETKATILDNLEQFLTKHSKSEDLGLRLDGEQLAAGVRFVRLAKENVYDLVVGNPPYSDLGLLSDPRTLANTYPRSKANLYSCFIERSLELAKSCGISALLTMRGWLFIKEYEAFRGSVLRENALLTIGDFDRGAFEEVPNDLLSVVVAVLRKGSAVRRESVAVQPFSFDDRSYDRERTARKRAATLAQVGRYEFDIDALYVVPGWPLVFWWSPPFLATYAAAPKVARAAPIRQGMATSDNTRFLRHPHELEPSEELALRGGRGARWAAYIKGADGAEWCEPLRFAVRWENHGVELKVFHEERHGSYSKRIPSEKFYFQLGIAFSTIGDTFSARLHMYPSIIDAAGCSVFPHERDALVCLLNSSTARFVLQSLNPTISFKNNDVERLCVLPVRSAPEVCRVLVDAFGTHERGREPSVEFCAPRPDTWRAVQRWAQTAVDCGEADHLPTYVPEPEQPSPASFVSFAIGVALGRFASTGEGMCRALPAAALPQGLLFVSAEGGDSLDHSGAIRILETWKEHGTAVGGGDDVSTYLRRSFFEFHKRLYESRPIYFPLSSLKKSFVAFVSIHHWADDTLNTLLADHLVPTKRRLEGELEDLRIARASGNNRGKAEKRFTDVQKLLEELNDFIAKVSEVAEKGPPPSDEKTERRQTDARFVMDLDDGVMVNSAVLWPILEPQWKDPKKWWKELANAAGKKDYDWSHLAARYFPKRVRDKCHTDPSLAVAHKCFWELHPMKAYAWELRLQDEIRPDFTIDEPSSNEARATFLADHAREAREIFAKELKRRERKSAKADDEGEVGPLFNQEVEEPEESDE